MSYSPFWNPEMETMGPNELRAIQEAKLRKQIAYTFENSPFYQRKFHEAGVRSEHIQTIEDLRLLPFTTKYELRDSQASHPPLGEHAAAPMEKVVRVHSSSGTTGRPSYVGITERDRQTWLEMVARCEYAEGVRPDSRVINAFGLGFFVGGIPLMEAVQTIGGALIPIGTGNSQRVLSSVQDLGADVIACTPSYAIYLAEFIHKQGIDPASLGIKLISSGAEPGAGIPGVKRKIEQAWGASIREGMGNADMAPVIFGECPAEQGMHFCGQEFIICELIDPDSGEVIPMEDGASGELVYTAIDRECVPLLRFRTRDRLTVWTSRCSCGRTSFRQRCIGRTDDMLIVLGVNVFPSAIRDVVSTFMPRTTGEIQVQLDAPGPAVQPPLRVRVEYGPEAQDMVALRKEVEDTLRAKLIVAISVELVPADTLPRFEMKAQLVRKLYEEA